MIPAAMSACGHIQCGHIQVATGVNKYCHANARASCVRVTPVDTCQCPAALRPLSTRHGTSPQTAPKPAPAPIHPHLPPSLHTSQDVCPSKPSTVLAILSLMSMRGHPKLVYCTTLEKSSTAFDVQVLRTVHTPVSVYSQWTHPSSFESVVHLSGVAWTNSWAFA